MKEARQRASSWSLGNVLRGTRDAVLGNLGTLQQPASNIANLIVPRILGSNDGTLPEALNTIDARFGVKKRAKAALSNANAYANQVDAKLSDLPQVTDPEDRRVRAAMANVRRGQAYSEANPLDANVFGPAAQAAAARLNAIKKKTRAVADSAVAAQTQYDKTPLLERVGRSIPRLNTFFDSRAGLQSSALEAGWHPENAMTLEFLNPLQLSPLDLSGILAAGAWRGLVEKKPIMQPFHYEGLLPKGRRPFEPKMPRHDHYTTPIERLEEVKARRVAALEAQPGQRFDSSWRNYKAQVAEDAATKAEIRNRENQRGWDAQDEADRQHRARELQRQMDDAIAFDQAEDFRKAYQAAPEKPPAAPPIDQRARELQRQMEEAATQDFDAEQAAHWVGTEDQHYAAERGAEGAASAGFNPDPGGVARGWRAKSPPPVAPPEVPLLDRSQAPPDEGFIARPDFVDHQGAATPPSAPPPQAPPPATLTSGALAGFPSPPPARGWRAALPPSEPPAAPRVAPPPIALPVAQEAPQGPRIAPQEILAQEAPTAPPQQAPARIPSPPVEVPRVGPPTAPAYAPIEQPGVREPSSVPALGAGDEAAPPVRPPVTVAESIAKRWDTMSPRQRSAAMELLPPKDRAQVTALVAAEKAGLKSRYAPGSRATYKKGFAQEIDKSKWDPRVLHKMNLADVAGSFENWGKWVEEKDAKIANARAHGIAGIIKNKADGENTMWRAISESLPERPSPKQVKDVASFLRGEGDSSIIDGVVERWGDDWERTGGEILGNEAVIPLHFPGYWSAPEFADIKKRSLGNLEKTVSNATDGMGYIEYLPDGTAEIRIVNAREFIGNPLRYRSMGGPGFFGATPQVIEEMDRAMAGAGKLALSLVDAAKSTTGKAIAAGGGFSPGVTNTARAAKALVDRVFSRRMLSDSVKGADLLDELVSTLKDLEQASARRANDKTAALRTAPLDEREVANAALASEAIRGQLRGVHPTLAKTVDELRGALDDQTHAKLAQQYQVSRQVWDALGEAQQRELGRYLQMADETAPGGSPASAFEAFKAATLSRLKASGALRKNADGKWGFANTVLDVDQALDNLGQWAPRKYSAFEGGKRVFDVRKVIDANESQFGPGGATPNPDLLLDASEKAYLHNKLSKKIQSALAKQDRSAVAHLLEREHVSPRLRAALGELKDDPGYRVALGLHQLERDVARGQAFEAMAGNEDWVMPLVPQGGDLDAAKRAATKRWGVAPVQVPPEANYNLLQERWVHPEVADLLRLHFGGPGEGGLATTIRNLTNLWKANVTVLNPDSQVRQFLQNWVQGDLAGAGAVGHAANLKTAAGELHARGPLYEQARDAGLFSGTFHDTELTREIHEAILSIPPAASSLEALGHVTGALGALSKKAGNVWQATDDIHRLAAYLHAVNNGASPRDAVKHVRDTLYDGSKMSRFERFITGRGVSNTYAEPGVAAKGLDLVSAVVNAPFGMATMFTARNAVRSVLGMKSGRWVPFSDPALALRASKYWALPLLLHQGLTAEDDAARPAHEKPVLDHIMPLSVKLPDATSTFLGQDGKPQFFGYKSLLPWGEVAGIVWDRMDDKASMVRALPGLGAHPFLQVGAALAGNENPFTRKPIWNDEMGGYEKVAAGLGYGTQALLPRLTPGLLGAIPAQAQRMADGSDPGLESFLEDTVRYGGPLFQRLGAGAYNDLVAGRANQEAHVPDYNMRDWSLPRALLSTAGVRTYEGDAERNAMLRALERAGKLNDAKKDFVGLMLKPGRSEKTKEADRKRFVGDVQRIATGEPVRPTLGDLRRILTGAK